MNKSNYTYYEIDTADIWLYEFNRMKVNGEIKIYDDLLQIIEPIISDKGKSFLSDSRKPDGWSLKYTTDYDLKYKARKTDYFRFSGEYFSFDNNLIIHQDRHNSRDFAFLFALKLRQYHDNLPALDAFLYYQLKANFSKELKHFSSFLQSLLIQFDELLDVKFEKKLALWESFFDPGVLERTADAELFDDPVYWQSIEITLNDKQVREFFSFLYEARNDKGKAFLEKDEVAQLLRHGFKVPPNPLPKKFKLNLTPRNRKSIIEYAVFQFYFKYSGNLKNKQPFLRFLAYQFEDFSKVQTDGDFRNWGKNFTEKKLKMDLPFNIQQYFDRAKSA